MSARINYLYTSTFPIWNFQIVEWLQQMTTHNLKDFSIDKWSLYEIEEIEKAARMLRREWETKHGGAEKQEKQ